MAHGCKTQRIEKFICKHVDGDHAFCRRGWSDDDEDSDSDDGAPPPGKEGDGDADSDSDSKRHRHGPVW